jgi:DNA sulfur modification protein DndB
MTMVLVLVDVMVGLAADLVPKIFLFDEDEIPAEMRAQRAALNRARIPEIAEYITANPEEYVFSSLTASVDGNVTFEPWGGESSMIGTLSVPMASRIVINDGQHRRAGIEEARKNKPDLGEETLSIVFFIDDGLRRSQQMFADLNKHAIRPTKSLGILYDLRDPLSKLARDLASEVPSFKGLTKTEKLQFQIVQLSWSTGRVFI